MFHTFERTGYVGEDKPIETNEEVEPKIQPGFERPVATDDSRIGAGEHSVGFLNTEGDIKVTDPVQRNEESEPEPLIMSDVDREKLQKPGDKKDSPVKDSSVVEPLTITPVL